MALHLSQDPVVVMQIQSTKGAGTDRLKILVYGASGAGKTTLAKTTPDHAETLIISAEGGLLSLADVDIPFVDITAAGDPMQSLSDTYWTLREQPHPYRWLFIDSISELAEVCLADALKSNADGRAAYGALATTMKQWVKAFRDLPVHVVMTAKEDRVKTTDGLLYGPDMPGKQLTQGLPYFFDEVFALRIVGDPDDGGLGRWLQTGRDQTHDAKDRSGKLSLWEPANLAHIHRRICGTDTEPT